MTIVAATVRSPAGQSLTPLQKHPMSNPPRLRQRRLTSLQTGDRATKGGAVLVLSLVFELTLMSDDPLILLNTTKVFGPVDDTRNCNMTQKGGGPTSDIAEHDRPGWTMYLVSRTSDEGSDFPALYAAWLCQPKGLTPLRRGNRLNDQALLRCGTQRVGSSETAGLLDSMFRRMLTTLPSQSGRHALSVSG